jgi:hypothetical protein
MVGKNSFGKIEKEKPRINHGFKTRSSLGLPGTQPTQGWNRAGLKKKQGKEKLK